MTSKDDVPENGQERVAGQRETVVGDTTKRVSNSSFKGQGFNKAPVIRHGMPKYWQWARVGGSRRV
jgi:hypothetical protein